MECPRDLAAVAPHPTAVTVYAVRLGPFLEGTPTGQVVVPLDFEAPAVTQPYAGVSEDARGPTCQKVVLFGSDDLAETVCAGDGVEEGPTNWAEAYAELAQAGRACAALCSVPSAVQQDGKSLG